MRTTTLFCLSLIACDISVVANASLSKKVVTDAGADSNIGTDTGLDSNVGVDASTCDSSIQLLDSGLDSSDSLTCESGTLVVGHCLFNMATRCQEYFSDHSIECKQAHPMGGAWWDGPCGSESGTDLHRSSGGCKDSCGNISWSYPLGNEPPTAATTQVTKDMCVGTYVSTNL